MAKYRKKPEYVEAIRYDGNNVREIMDFIHDDVIMLPNSELGIKQFSNIFQAAKPGDYIVKDGLSTTVIDNHSFKNDFEPDEDEESVETKDGTISQIDNSHHDEIPSLGTIEVTRI